MSMRALGIVALLGLALSLAGCGGGGGGGGGGSGGMPAPQNVQPISVDAGPAGIANILFVTVTVCAPGSSSNCQTIDHVQVDTGSSGLRLIASVLSPALSLPQQVDANGNPLVECVQFVDGFSWGPVKQADMRVAGEQATSLSVQIIGDPAFPSVPTGCSNSGPPENTVQTFGANGLLGIGLFLHDCGSTCAQTAIPGAYYSCPASGCVPTTVAVAHQVQNPVALFSVDNNGTIIELASIPAAGAATAAGSLIFGIGTQTNNGLGSAKVIATDPNTGFIATLFNSQTYTTSYIDSGSTLFFIGAGLYPMCTRAAAGFYCPAATQNLAATLQGVNGASSAANFSIANADQLFSANSSFFAFDNLGAPGGGMSVFAWGLPFFYGRNIYTALETKQTPGGMGPYVAF
jgi:hypothetical protein